MCGHLIFPFINVQKIRKNIDKHISKCYITNVEFYWTCKTSPIKIKKNDTPGYVCRKEKLCQQ